MLDSKIHRLIIIGAGGHGKVIADCAISTSLYSEIAFLDDDPKENNVLGIPVIGRLNDVDRLHDKYSDAFVAIGNNNLRMKIINRLKSLRYRVPVLIHPTAIVSEYSLIGNGSVVLAGAIVSTDAVVDEGCIINTASSIDHDCKLGKGVHISPGAKLGGMVNIGDCSWICIGANIVNNINIGKNSIIAAGAAVIRDVDDFTLVAGVPAILKKRLVENEK